MGDRAVISNKNKNLGVYLHWYGYRSFVESVLAYCDLKGYRSPDVDDEYGWARLCQVIGNTLGGTLSLGIGNFNCMDTDNWDNGTYIIQGWDIKERLYQRYGDEKLKATMFENLEYVNSKQPKEEQLPKEQVKAFADLWEIKNIDRLSDERKAIVEEQIKKQEQEEKAKEKQDSTDKEQNVEKASDEKGQDSLVTDKKGQFMTKAEFLEQFSTEFDKDTQPTTGENEVKEQVIPYQVLEKNGKTYELKGGGEHDR